jgi:hypothetical protein
MCLSGHLAYLVVMRGSKTFELLVKSKQGLCFVGGGCALKCGKVCVTVSPSPQSKDEENEKLHKL